MNFMNPEIGPVPVLLFGVSAWHLMRVTLRITRPVETSTMAAILFASGTVALLTKLLWIATPVALTTTALLLCAIASTAVAFAIDKLVTRQFRTSSQKLADLKTLPELLGRLALSVGLCIGLYTLAIHSKEVILGPVDCKRAMCRAGEFMLGSRTGAFSLLWAWCSFSTLFIVGLRVSTIALLRRLFGDKSS